MARPMNRRILRWAIFSIFMALAFIVWPRSGEVQTGFTSAKVCASCHTEIYYHWSNSLHANSVSDPLFEALYFQVIKEGDTKAKETCLRCHAPTTRVTKDFNLTQEVTREGVTCDFCHSISRVNPGNRHEPYSYSLGRVTTGSSRRIPSRHQPLDLTVQETSEFCGVCHEHRGRSGVLIMGTYSEWRDSPYAAQGVKCQDCHMPTLKIALTAGPGAPSTRKVNNHNIQGGHSLEQLRQALKVEIADIEKVQERLRVTVNLTNIGSGHMVPTGIPSRKLTLIVKFKDPSGEVIGKDFAHYQKVLADEQGRVLDTDLDQLLKAARVISDNRIAPKEVRQEVFYFPVPKGFGKKYFLVPQKGDYTIEAEVYYHYSPLILQKTDISVEMTRDTVIVPR